MNVLARGGSERMGGDRPFSLLNQGPLEIRFVRSEIRTVLNRFKINDSAQISKE